MEDYRVRLHRVARKDFRAFWSSHRVWAAMANMLAPIILMTITARQGVDRWWLLFVGVASFAISLAGNYVISMWRAAKSMDSEHAEHNAQLNARLAAQSQEIDQTGQQIVEASRDEIAQRAVILERNAPRPLIEYWNDGGVQERITITNEGTSTMLRVLAILPLTWTEERQVSLGAQVKPLPPSNSDECSIRFRGRDGIVPLPELLKQPSSPDARATIALIYQDESANQYRRDFELTIFNDGRVVWQPGAVVLARPAY